MEKQNCLSGSASAKRPSNFGFVDAIIAPESELSDEVMTPRRRTSESRSISPSSTEKAEKAQMIIDSINEENL